MDETTTRRRVIQGAGIIGATGIVGSSVVTAQEQTPTTQDGETALRVAHASPDAPDVTVRLDDQAVVEGLSFGNVTSYQSVDPGTYQLRIVPAEQGLLGGFLSDLFGSQDGETVLYDQQVTVEQGATLTAVAFGEAGQGPAETPTGTATPTPDGGATPTEPAGTETGATPAMAQELQMGGGGQAGPLVQGLAFGESASATVPAGDYRLLIRPAAGDGGTTPAGTATPTPGGGSTPPDGETGTPEETGAFRVELLEDDLSSPSEGQSRVRIFHAVPNLGEVNIVATPQGGGQGQGQTPGQGQGGGQGQGQGGGQGQGQTPGQGQGGGQGQGQGGGQGQGPPVSADVSLEAGTVYSAFAVGYADTGTAEATPGQTPTEGTPGQTPTEGTPGQTPTEGTATGTPGGDRPEFELVVVETATDGQRVQNGGT
ncbi:DUF4397 domain-containing protein [Haloarcula sp. S1CR25-12]|uniref:DUF4397 domain-containing protein n=1 Tax=Haloarcula saliterrae TaxID=2950534 RepID=A0ABU2FGI7_9EURY|nr:DUF4397 domain-containing protein [Haloarcula sp. S1CR25-12]MDS0260856.1 DUF4397 domain-containing protein [Haloarcula sp. S1CR25-12]